MFISHDLRVVAALASRLMVLRNGKVVEEGAAAELFKAPKTDYTRALFAAAFRLEAVPRTCNEQPSYPAKAGYPVRRGLSIYSHPSRSTGSPACACAADDDGGCGYSRLIAVTSLPAALIRAIASRVLSITVAM